MQSPVKAVYVVVALAMFLVGLASAAPTAEAGTETAHVHGKYLRQADFRLYTLITSSEDASWL